MYLAIIVLPLLGSIISGFFGRKIGVSGAQFVSTSSIILTTILSIVTFVEVGINNTPVTLELFKWVDSESLNVLWSFNFDSLTVSMLLPVLIVSCLVHVYSVGYMSHDPHNQRFFSYLSLFTFMMIILVTANNFLLMFVGWEGVGICSYLLVSFWFTRIAANQSSISALLTNRVGDCFLTIGMFILLWSFGNVDYLTVFSLAPYVNENVVTLIGVCLLIGAMAKSSQVGLHVWLPMAMEGPTPVSALIHAATMVTAGVYLLMRTSPLIEYSSTVLVLCLWVGAVTTVFSSLIGLFQQDIKKVIAYSTMSQLGMMVIAVGLSSHNIALFHLVNHAFYKALLFLGAGSVIHAVADNQDFRKYGGLRPFLPLTYAVMLIASLSLVAFPFMTGFYSKDIILESAYGQFFFSGIAVYFIATIGAIFTTLYSTKILYLTFLGNPAGPKNYYKHVHESDMFMSIPLIILALFSIFFGYILRDAFIGLGTGFFVDNGIFIHPLHEIMLNTEFSVPSTFKLLPFVSTILFCTLSLLLFEYYYKVLSYFKSTRAGYYIFSFYSQRFYVEMFYNRYITNIILKLGGQTTKFLDKGSIELFGPHGLEKGLLQMSENISQLSSGIVTEYGLYVLTAGIGYILVPGLSDYSLLIIITFGLFSLVTFNQSMYTGLVYPSNPVSENILLSKKESSLKFLQWSIFNKKNFNKFSRILTIGFVILIIRFYVMKSGFNLDTLSGYVGAYFPCTVAAAGITTIWDSIADIFSGNKATMGPQGNPNNSTANEIKETRPGIYAMEGSNPAQGGSSHVQGGLSSEQDLISAAYNMQEVDRQINRNFQERVDRDTRNYRSARQSIQAVFTAGSEEYKNRMQEIEDRLTRGNEEAIAQRSQEREQVRPEDFGINLQRPFSPYNTRGSNRLQGMEMANIIEFHRNFRSKVNFRGETLSADQMRFIRDCIVHNDWHVSKRRAMRDPHGLTNNLRLWNRLRNLD